MDPKVQEMNRQISSLADKGNLSQAESIFQELENEGKGTGATYFMMARLYFSQGEFEKGNSVWEKLKSLQAPFAASFLNLAAACADKGYTKQALGFLKEMREEYKLEIPPAQVFKLNKVAQELGAKKDFDGLYQALDINPGNLDAKQQKSLLLLARNMRFNGNREAALELLKTSIENKSLDKSDFEVNAEFALCQPTFQDVMAEFEKICEGYGEDQVAIPENIFRAVGQRYRDAKDREGELDKADLDKMVHLFELLQKYKVHLSRGAIYHTALHDALKLKDLDLAARIFLYQTNQELDASPNLRTFYSLCNNLPQSGFTFPDFAQKVAEKGYNMTEKDLASALRVAASNNDHDFGNAVLQVAKDNNLDEELNVQLAKVRFLSDTLQTDAAIDLVENLDDDGGLKREDGTSVKESLLIRAYAGAGNMAKVKEIISDLKSQGDRKAAGGYRALLDALWSFKNDSEFEQTIEEMKREKLTNQLANEKILLWLMSRNRHDEALEFVQDVVSRIYAAPKIRPFNILLEHFGKKKNMTAVGEILDMLLEKDVRPNIGTATALGHSFRALNRDLQNKVRSWIRTARLPVRLMMEPPKQRKNDDDEEEDN